MIKMCRSGFILMIVFVIIGFQPVFGDVNTYTDLPAFLAQRPCAQSCINDNINPKVRPGPYKIARNIGCEFQIIKEDCLCRADLQPKASGYVRSCVSEGCAGRDIDITPAVAIYTDFCTSLGYYAAANVATPTTDVPVVPTTVRNNAPTAIQTTPPSSSNSTNSSASDPSTDSGSTTGTRNPDSKDDNGLQMKDIIGIAISAVGVLVAIIAFIWMRWPHLLRC